MSESVQEFLGDGDGPATEGAPESKRGPLLVMSRPVTANWRVSREGELVVIELGNLPALRLRAKDAIPFGNAIMAKGIEARVQAGDASKRIETR